MHLLKYRGVLVYADVVAEALVDRLPALPLVPVPRALSRKVRYGVDPAQQIAKAVSRLNGAPCLEALARPLHTPRRAGRDHHRNVPKFTLARPLPPAVVVVDDVVTTGATVAAAVTALGLGSVRLVAAANTVSSMPSLSLS